MAMCKAVEGLDAPARLIVDVLPVTRPVGATQP